MTTVQVNPLHATRLPDDVQCYQIALDAAFAAGVAAEREWFLGYIQEHQPSCDQMSKAIRARGGA